MWSWTEKSYRWWVWLNSQSLGIPALLINTTRAGLSAEASLMAASIAYFALLSLFPLTLLTVALASIWLDASMAEAELVQRLEFIAPGLQQLLGENIDYVIQSRAPVSGLAFLTVLWSASNIFNIITRGLNRVWLIREARSAWRHRGLAMAGALVLSAILLITMFIGGFVATAREAITLPVGLSPRVITYTNGFIGASINAVAFAAFYYFLPHRQADWQDVIPGAVGAGFLWELAKRGFLNFVAVYLTRSNLVYGSVATIIAFLTWSYFSGIIFMLGAYLNVNLHRLRHGLPPRAR